MNTPKTDALTLDAELTFNSYQKVMASHRQLETQVQELRATLSETIKYLEDDLWVSGESRQLQRESARTILEKTK